MFGSMTVFGLYVTGCVAVGLAVAFVLITRVRPRGLLATALSGLPVCGVLLATWFC